MAKAIDFDGGRSSCELSDTLRQIIENNGFKINENKVRLSSKSQHQEVTGLVVNVKANVKRKRIRQIRAMLHQWRQAGLTVASTNHATLHGRKSDFRSSLRGQIEFVGQIKGRHDGVFKNLANQFNALTPHSRIRTELSREESISLAVWVLEDEETEEQATTFLLKDYGLVTCAHAVGDKPFIYHPSNPARKIPVQVLKKDEHRDLAVLELPAELKDLIPIRLRSLGSILVGNPITLYGYPNHSPGRPIRMEAGKLIRKFPKSGVAYLEVSPKIIGGNSGGPILDSLNRLAGVAVRGLNGKIDLTTAEFFAVDATEIKTWLGKAPP